MRKIKHFCFIVLLFSIFILTKRTEAAVQDANDSTLTVQWKDENFGALICKALKKEEVIYADIEGITGISIDSQYTVKRYVCNTCIAGIFYTGGFEEVSSTSKITSE